MTWPPPQKVAFGREIPLFQGNPTSVGAGLAAAVRSAWLLAPALCFDWTDAKFGERLTPMKPEGNSSEQVTFLYSATRSQLRAGCTRRADCWIRNGWSLRRTRLSHCARSDSAGSSPKASAQACAIISRNSISRSCSYGRPFHMSAIGHLRCY